MSICRNFVFRKIPNEVRPVHVRGEAFPALFVGGFHKIGTSCDVPDWVFGLYFVISSFLIKLEKVRPRESQGLSNAALKNGLSIAPPKLPWKITLFWYVCRTLKKEKKNTITFG